MSTQNICFHVKIKKNISWIPPLILSYVKLLRFLRIKSLFNLKHSPDKINRRQIDGILLNFPRQQARV